MRALLLACMLGLAVLRAAEAKDKFSLAPLGGTNPVYGVFFGVGAFYRNEEKTKGFGLVTVITFKDSYQFRPTVFWQLGERWRLDLNSEISIGFDPYFGEGINTKNIQTNIFGTKYIGTLAFPYALGNGQEIGPFVRYLARRERGIDDDRNRHAFPNEGSFAVGVRHSIDRKDRRENPNHGWHEYASIWAVPRGLMTSDYKTDTLVQGELRIGVVKSIFPKWIIASQALFDGTLGDPSYLNRFRLGGTDRLRGYYENRFRGENAALLQTELRFPLFWLLSGVIFTDQGSVSETLKFTKIRYTYGGGLRVALPPDKIQQARIDFGIAPDQQGVSVDFGHTF